MSSQPKSRKLKIEFRLCPSQILYGLKALKMSIGVLNYRLILVGLVFQTLDTSCTLWYWITAFDAETLLSCVLQVCQVARINSINPHEHLAQMPTCAI